MAASLNKCVDAQGKITYSNLLCNNAREVRKVEIDPAPLPDPVLKKPVVKAAPQPAKTSEPAAPVQLDAQHQGSKKTSTKVSARQCDSLSEQLGKVMDKMDAARRQGYTQKQMDDWNHDVKTLERKKQQSGCF